MKVAISPRPGKPGGRLLTHSQVADLFFHSEDWRPKYRWLRDNVPCWIKLGRRTYWPENWVVEFLNTREPQL